MDPGFLLFVLPAALFSFWAQTRVVRAFGRYSRVPARAGVRAVLGAAALTYVAALAVALGQLLHLLLLRELRR